MTGRWASAGEGSEPGFAGEGPLGQKAVVLFPPNPPPLGRLGHPGQNVQKLLPSGFS